MSNLLEIGKSGILANQRALDVTGQNISNAANPDYSRRRVELQEQAFREGNRYLGLGVKVDDLTRFRSEITDERIRGQESELGFTDEKQKILKQLEVVLSTDNNMDLDVRLTDFFNAFSKLAANPEDNTIRENVIREAEELTQTFGNLNAEISAIQQNAIDRADNQAAEINNLLREIASLNQNVTAGEGEGVESDFDSIDKRTAKLRELSELADVSITEDDNRSLTVRIGGIVVVQDDQFKQISAETDLANDIARLRLDNGAVISNVGGRIGASLESVRDEIPTVKDQLDNLASALVRDVNRVHSEGYGLNNATGVDFFNPDNTNAANIELSTIILNDADYIAASNSQNAPGNGGNANELANLRNAQNAIESQTYVEYSVSISADVGSRINQLETRNDTAESAQNLLIEQQESIAGVNIDEELANLIRYQNAYQASARVINAARQNFDTLLTLI